ncbi:hypothetical protein MINS_31580 [Mycolicibacterium insubricum]|jgi:hypothetical protein|uniref:hypothetical protein n=1 Tax=Mycolicibacterium insubricum TaxID=444597 RepID=UPI0009F54BE9|nr:hypothetical protein [Mycolicibacterium insubricum]MCB9441294.1 hypothetical protein [Mycolicibacterium sp.]MCV7083825.1 hypothetical protein [Mycolicibacterium insubricum]BBZ67729.1 hypothetical protein MINS_31580 [Mycolicibacterium insubricum]
MTYTRRGTAQPGIVVLNVGHLVVSGVPHAAAQQTIAAFQQRLATVLPYVTNGVGQTPVSTEHPGGPAFLGLVAADRIAAAVRFEIT